MSDPLQDRVMFLMPDDLELQFPAMAILQTFVTSYENKLSDPLVNPTQIKFNLSWDIRISDADWNFWERAGLSLPTPKIDIDDYDMLIDFSDRRLRYEDWPEKHACQVCSFLSGVDAAPLPRIRRVSPKIDMFVWRDVESQITLPELLLVKDREITGVVGIAGAVTYLAASMGLAVVEILPEGRPKNWLSKWTTAGYRQIETQNSSIWPTLIKRATDSVELEINWHKQKIAQKEGASVRG